MAKVAVQIIRTPRTPERFDITNIDLRTSYDSTLEEMLKKSPMQENIAESVNAENFPTFGEVPSYAGPVTITLVKVFEGFEDADWESDYDTAMQYVSQMGLDLEEFPAIVAITSVWEQLKAYGMESVLSLAQHSRIIERRSVLGLLHLQGNCKPRYGLYRYGMGFSAGDYVVCRSK